MNKIPALPRNLFLTFGSLVMALAGEGLGQEVVFNGSFQNVSDTFVADGNKVMSLAVGAAVIPGWTTTGAELVWASNTNVFGPTTPYGDFFVDLTGYHDSPPYAGVTQALSTTPGQAYQVSFALGQHPQKSAYSGPVSVRADTGVISDNVYTLTPTNGGGNQWTNFQISFVAQGSSTVITLTGVSAQGGHYVGLDNVSLKAQDAGPELLINGSLENVNGSFVNQSLGAMSLPVHSTNIAGWFSTAAEVGWVTNSTPLGIVTPFGGMFLDLTGFHDNVPYGGIEQVAATVPGQSYTLSFAVGVDQNNPSYSGPVAVEAAVRSGAIFTTEGDGSDWQSFGFTFVANGSATPLAIIGESAAGGAYLGLDQVSVTPAESALLITTFERLTGASLLLGFNSQLGHSYAVQSRTDLATGTWTPLPETTNAGNGSTIFLTLTNAISGPGQFYRIQQVQ